MIDSETRKHIIALVRREVVPAVGCTEPMAVALAAARAAEILGTRSPEKINVRLSANILKNALGVGIPGTDMIGLPVAIALGVIIGESAKKLELLAEVTPDSLAAARELMARGIISISLKEGISEKLYIEVELSDSFGNSACAVIAGSHTHFSVLSRNGIPLLDRASCSVGSEEEEDGDIPLKLKTVWEFATESPLSEIDFILQAEELNRAIARKSLDGSYGHSVGNIIRREKALLGDSVFTRILSSTTAACDARMAGAPFPVMSNSGSGNQGIAATLPVSVYASEIGASREQLVRALMLSHLVVIYIKQSLGRLSALCGCVVAATGSACGICYLMGGDFSRISATAKNMVANLTGMICDGAKPSCAMKLASGVSTAVLSAVMAMDGQCVTSDEGIVDDDVDKTIFNLTSIGRDAMVETDRMILKIMTE